MPKISFGAMFLTKYVEKIKVIITVGQAEFAQSNKDQEKSSLLIFFLLNKIKWCRLEESNP